MSALPRQLLTRAPEGGTVPDEIVKLVNDALRRPPRIRCPKCFWVPKKDSLWQCGPRCGHRWNTFDTAGKCPRCAKQWAVTQCTCCGVYSAHGDWYVVDPLPGTN